MDNVLVSRFP